MKSISQICKYLSLALVVLVSLACAWSMGANMTAETPAYQTALPPQPAADMVTKTPAAGAGHDTTVSNLQAGPRWVSPTAPAVCVVSTGWADGTVNIRSGPGMDWSVVGFAHEGDRLMLTNRAAVGGWREVTQAGQSAGTFGRRGWFFVVAWCKS